MKVTRSALQNVLLSLALPGLIAAPPAYAQTAASGFITGTVQGPKGPEAGVWVIAETKDLLTGFIKIVVTDDRGRFLVPDLPAANYKVWVRGYGLVDSTPLVLKPGAPAVTLKAVAAKSPQEAAKVYPGNYWLSLLEPPSKSLFPDTVYTTQGKETSLKTFSDWTQRIANSEVPPAPPRPKGIERNIVATLWDVGDDHSFMHDQISTDKNHP